MWIWDLIHFHACVHACMCVVCVAVYVCVCVCVTEDKSKNLFRKVSSSITVYNIKDWPKHTSVSQQNNCFLCNMLSALFALVFLLFFLSFGMLFLFFIPKNRQSNWIRMFTGIQYTFHVMYITTLPLFLHSNLVTLTCIQGHSNVGNVTMKCVVLWKVLKLLYIAILFRVKSVFW